MALPMITTYCAVLGTIVAYLIYSLAQIGRRPKDCPPGPPTLPLVGNLHLVNLTTTTSDLQRLRNLDPVKRPTSAVPKMGTRVRRRLLSHDGRQTHDCAIQR
jgi:hypothetical protein